MNEWKTTRQTFGKLWLQTSSTTTTKEMTSAREEPVYKQENEININSDGSCIFNYE